MKAKEYALNFNSTMSDEEFKKAVEKTIIDFFVEIDTILESRHSNSDSALLSILREQSDKWNALARLVSGLNHDGFKEVISIKLPEAKVLLGW